MKKLAIGNKKNMMKTMGLVLTLIFTICLCAGGVFADTGCGARCCQHISPDGMRHGAGNPIRSFSDCPFENSRIPCELQSKQAVTFPVYTLAPSNGGFPNHAGPMEISVDSIIDDNVVEPDGFIRAVWEKIQPPPIYLQIRSLLI